MAPLLPEQEEEQLLKRLMIFLVAGWSGFYLMAVELLSGRLLAPNFGSSIQVWGAIMTVFMVALSTGYLLGGLFSLKEPSLARFSLILVAAAALTAPAALFGETILEQVFVLILSPHLGALVSAALLFFLPTTVAGMVLPYAVRLSVSDSRLCGHHAGFLFFVSTLGSAAGTLVTSFYLVLVLDVHQIFWSLIGVSTALAAGTASLSLTGFKGESAEQELM